MSHESITPMRGLERKEREKPNLPNFKVNFVDTISLADTFRFLICSTSFLPRIKETFTEKVYISRLNGNLSDISAALSITFDFQFKSIFICFTVWIITIQEQVGSCLKGCLPFTWNHRKFRLENQMVRIILFGTFCKLWATSCGNKLFVFLSI